MSGYLQRRLPAVTAQKGFSLVELAMVLLIIALLLGGLLVPLATQLESRQRDDAQQQLETIKEALIGYAIVNGKLPCHTTEPDPASANYGVSDDEATPPVACNPMAAATDDRILPWKTLGLTSGMDPWGIQRTSSGDPWTGHWRYRVDSKFISTFALSDTPTDGLNVVELDTANSTSGSPAYVALTAASEAPVAIVYSTGANRERDGVNAGTVNVQYEGGSVSNLDRDGDGDKDSFDDVTTWLSRPLLFNRMVTVGRLP